MQTKDCKVGMRVADQSWQPCRKGTVKSEVEFAKNNNPMVIVEWDGGSLQKMMVHSLITEVEGIVHDTNLRQEAERLEAEFEKVEVMVSAKIKVAADAINEAIKLAREKGFDLQDHMYDAALPLMRALDNAGWSSSSLSC